MTEWLCSARLSFTSIARHFSAPMNGKMKIDGGREGGKGACKYDVCIGRGEGCNPKSDKSTDKLRESDSDKGGP